MKRFGLAICGMGSAGSGLLLAAANNGVLDTLLGSGVVGFERSRLAELESNLRGFQVAANSYGGAFLEILDDPAGSHVLAGAREAPETRRLLGSANVYPDLEKIGAFMTIVCRRTAALLDEARGCELHAGTSVESVAVEDGGVEVTAADGQRYVADHVALTMGGIESTDVDGGAVARILELGLADRLCRAGEVLRDLARFDEVDEIAVFGGSHSAWAALVGLLRRRPGRIIHVVERRWPPIFYASAQDADRDGYDYDPEQDVCPRSGRVNRFGGLRGPARELALSVMAGRLPNVRVTNDADGWKESVLVDAGALPARVLVAAFGYGPRLPRLTWRGMPLHPKRAGAALAVGSTGVVRDEHGIAVPGLYAFGMGAGLVPSEEVGGERSYRGRLDGVWLYQHTVGTAVLRSMGLL